MNIAKSIAGIFFRDDSDWLKHANPWSIWTRFATLPFIILAVWSRVWIGWYCLLPLAVLCLWILINPILFKQPKHFNHWGSQAVLGERLLATKNERIPSHHKTPIMILNILQTMGGILLIIGLWKMNVYLTLHGVTFVYLAKMWFLDRMVWIYQEMEVNREHQ